MLKLRKILLVAITAIILPLALVSVGYAQELNCWGLRSTREEDNKPSEDSFQHISHENKASFRSTSCLVEDDVVNRSAPE